MQGLRRAAFGLEIEIDPEVSPGKFTAEPWLGSAFRRESSARDGARLAVAPPTGTAGFPAGSPPARLDAGSAASARA
jgi:hypothetical protein